MNAAEKARCGCTVGCVHEYACGLVGRVDPPRQPARPDAAVAAGSESDG